MYACLLLFNLSFKNITKVWEHCFNQKTLKHKPKLETSILQTCSSNGCYKGPGAITASTGHNYKDAAAYKRPGAITASTGQELHSKTYNTGWLQTKGLEHTLHQQVKNSHGCCCTLLKNLLSLHLLQLHK